MQNKVDLNQQDMSQFQVSSLYPKKGKENYASISNQNILGRKSLIVTKQSQSNALLTQGRQPVAKSPSNVNYVNRQDILITINSNNSHGQRSEAGDSRSKKRKILVGRMRPGQRIADKSSNDDSQRARYENQGGSGTRGFIDGSLKSSARKIQNDILISQQFIMDEDQRINRAANYVSAQVGDQSSILRKKFNNLTSPFNAKHPISPTQFQSLDVTSMQVPNSTTNSLRVTQSHNLSSNKMRKSMQNCKPPRPKRTNDARRSVFNETRETIKE